MSKTTVVAVTLGLVVSACTNDGAPPGAAVSSKPSPSATTVASAAASPSASATASASAAAADSQCKKRELTMGGSGTREDMCKYEGDILQAKHTGRSEDGGVVFSITNPWSEEITWLTAAVFYYDEDGKQLDIELDDKQHKSSRVNGLTVKLRGEATTDLALGFKKAELPSTVAAAELQVLSFGTSPTGGAPAYFVSSKRYTGYRAINGGNGPTGIAVCDAYREMLEGCPKHLPDALTQARKWLRKYNNTAPQIRVKMAGDLAGTCESAMQAAKDKCPQE